MPSPSVTRRALWWAADYAYAFRRQLAGVVPSWAFGHARRAPRAWRDGSVKAPEILLLPGVYEHWTFLRPLGDAIAAAGFRVAVVHGLGANRRTVTETADQIRRHLDVTPCPAGRVLVAHSKGGLIGKHLLLDEHPDILGLIAIATPFAGSRRAQLLRARTIRSFLPTDETIVTLGGSTGVNARIVSIFGPYDPHIPEGSALDGATNVLVPTAGHFCILGAPSTHQAVHDAIALLSSAIV